MIVTTRLTDAGEAEMTDAQESELRAREGQVIATRSMYPTEPTEPMQTPQTPPAQPSVGASLALAWRKPYFPPPRRARFSNWTPSCCYTQASTCSTIKRGVRSNISCSRARRCVPPSVGSP